MIENIIISEEKLAIIIRSNHHEEGIQFFTDGHFSQQLGYMNRPKGYTIPPHRHNLVPREVIQTQEVLFIKSGKVRVDFYNDQVRILSRSDDVILKESHLNKAKNNVLQMFEYLGDFSNFEHSMNLISDRLGLVELNSLWMNRCLSGEESLPDDAVHSFAEMNYLDLQLYEWLAMEVWGRDI